MTSALLSVLYAVYLSVRHARALTIKPAESWRYLKKSTNFALCYLGFRSRASLVQAIMAGRAAFLCCAYDVVTDWRSFATVLREEFRRILGTYSAPDLVELAMSLYQKDRDGVLEEDGLERGSIAFAFVVKMMGTESYFEKMADVKRVGFLLQLVDDILDFEEDAQFGDINCLTSPRREYYLQLAGELSEDFIDLFSSKLVLPYVIRRAKVKAETLSECLIQGSSGLSVPSIT